MAKILIPTPLRQYAGKQDAVQLAGKTVGEVLQSLTSQYSDLKRHLNNDKGKLRSFVDRKSTRLNSSHRSLSRMPSSA